MSKPRKLVLIGLDGATLRLLRPLVDAGVMPTLGAFMRDGACGTLLSTHPPVTCPAWPTMFTGVNPGKHGVFSFTCRRGGKGAPHTATSLDLSGPTVWDLAGAAGLRVGVLNVPITFPARRVNGVLVSGFPAPDDSPKIVWPRSEFADIKRDLPEFTVNWPGVGERVRTDAQKIRMIESATDLLRARSEAFTYFLGRHEVDFCFVVFEYPDKMQHKFYPILERMSGEAQAAADSPVLGALHEGYRVLDDALARLVEHFGDKANYVIVSDHGFGSVRRVVYLNHLLEQHGLVRTRRLKALTARVASALRLPLGVRARLGLAQDVPWHRLDTWVSPLIDFARTRAFAGHQYEHAVYINLKNRCPRGTVDEGHDYTTVRQKVIEVLGEAVDPRTGDRIFARVWPREELYSGEHVESAPDLIFDLAPGYVVSGGVGLSFPLDGGFLRDAREDDIAGYHLPDGIFIGRGPAFRRNEGFTANMVDVTPTVLALLGIAVPQNMDGRILDDAVRVECLGVGGLNADVEADTEERAESVYTAEQEMEITQRLADLGYI